MSRSFHVTCIGNAIVDVFTREDDAFIERNGLVKSSMTLIEADEADRLYAKMSAGMEVSGGSAGNTAAGLASLGARAAFIGKVADDQLGQVFAHDIRAAGVHFDTPVLQPPPPTARSLIIVTPDAHRTMNTYLGACVELGPEDVDEAVIAASAVTYMEGYLWDKPRAKEAFLYAAQVAHEAGRKVSLTLSDTFCVERHRESFLELVEGHIDLLFANEAEIKALYRTDDLTEATTAARGICELVVVTRSERGSIVLEGPSSYEVVAEPIGSVVDTTGAGDLYAAGFLRGLTEGRHLAVCARMGSIAAGEVISHIGARPQQPLDRLVARKLQDA